jgi:hypothetical protein
MSNVIGVETNLPRNAWPVGAGFTFRVLVTADGLATGTPVNNTGRTYRFVLEKANGDNIWELPGITTFANVNGVNDAVDVAVPNGGVPAATPPQQARWALRRTDDSSDRPVAYGTAPLYQPAG